MAVRSSRFACSQIESWIFFSFVLHLQRIRTPSRWWPFEPILIRGLLAKEYEPPGRKYEPPRSRIVGAALARNAKRQERFPLAVWPVRPRRTGRRALARSLGGRVCGPATALLGPSCAPFLTGGRGRPRTARGQGPAASTWDARKAVGLRSLLVE